jgi:hypothetical protein
MSLSPPAENLLEFFSGSGCPGNPGCLLDELIARATIFPQAAILVAGVELPLPFIGSWPFYLY